MFSHKHAAMKNNYAQQLAWFEQEEKSNLVKDIRTASSHDASRFAAPKPAPVQKRTLTKTPENPSRSSQNESSLSEREPLDNIENLTTLCSTPTQGMLPAKLIAV